MVQNTPAVDDFEFSQSLEELLVQRGSLLDIPTAILRAEPFSQLQSTRHRLWIEIKRTNYGAGLARRQAEQTASRADVQKSGSRKVFDTQQLFKRSLCGLRTRLIHHRQESGPIRTERESLLVYHQRFATEEMLYVAPQSVSVLLSRISIAVRRRDCLSNRGSVST